MDNQHKLIKGYRDLSKDEILRMNEGKELAEQVGNFIKRLREDSRMDTVDVTIDPRWLAIAETDLQKGFMSLIRSIARPETF